MDRRRFLTGLGLAATGAGLSGAGWALRPTIRKWLRPDLRLTELDAVEPDAYEVCIIGSGPAGAALGRDLAASGVSTLILESGYGPDGGAHPGIHRLETYRSTGPTEYPIASTRTRLVGGTSSMWTGRCSRMHPIDFEPNAYTPTGTGWPIGYDEIRPFYARAERTLRVRGRPLSEYHAPRETELPITVESGPSDLLRLLRGHGIVADVSPSSTARYGNNGPVRAPADLLPGFTDRERTALVPGATVTRLDADANGRIVGVNVGQLDGPSVRLRPRIVVIACGGLETTRLMLLSRSERFPDGLGNVGGHLGRYFMEHPNITLRARMPTEKPGPSLDLVRCHQFYDSFKEAGLGSVLLRAIWASGPERRFRIGASVEMAPHADNRLTLANERRDAFGSPGLDLHMTFHETERRTFAAARELLRDLLDRLGATDVEEESMTWSHHHMGTCRMADDPARGVIDPDLRVHGCDNLYALSSAAWVTGGAAHPTLLIVAFAHRLATHLAARLRGVASASLLATGSRL